MNKFILLVLSVGAFIYSVITLVDFRAGRRRVFQKTKVKENSFLRKVFPYKGSEINPLIYAKVIPVLVQTTLLIGVIIFYIVYWICPQLVSPFFDRPEYYILSIMVLLPQMIYSGILMI